MSFLSEVYAPICSPNSNAITSIETMFQCLLDVPSHSYVLPQKEIDAIVRTMDDTLTTTHDECDDDAMRIIEEAQTAFQKNVVNYNYKQHHLNEMLNDVNTCSTNRAIIAGNLRLFKSIYEKYVTDQDVMQDLHVKFEELIEHIETFVETSLSHLESKVEEMKDECRLLSVELKKGIKLFRCKTMVSGPNLCSICLNEPISMFCIPCGHTYCSKCICSTKKCHICRAEIHRVNKLFFP